MLLKCSPRTTIWVPPVVGPIVGNTVCTIADWRYENWTPSAEYSSPLVVTSTAIIPTCPGGNTQLTLVGVIYLAKVVTFSPNRQRRLTPVALNPSPKTITVIPPFNGPYVGLTLYTDAGAS